MELTLFQRQVLVNQYAILEKIAEDEDEKNFYHQKQEIYEQGFEYEYFENTPYTDVLSREDCKLAYKIINMYDDLYFEWSNSKELREEIDEIYVSFPGFDLNDNVECKFYSYAKFLMQDLHKFHDSRKLMELSDFSKLNSHGFGPGLVGYQALLKRYNETYKPGTSLTIENMKYIIGK